VAAVRDLTDVSGRLSLADTAREPFGYGERSLYFCQSRVYAYAGRAADAGRAQAAALALVPPGTPIVLADVELNTALSLVLWGDPSEGARHVARTVEAMPGAYRDSALIRQNAAQVLALVPAGAAGLPAVAEARELLALPSGAGV
jgi:hypothetical protein